MYSFDVSFADCKCAVLERYFNFIKSTPKAFLQLKSILHLDIINITYKYYICVTYVSYAYIYIYIYIPCISHMHQVYIYIYIYIYIHITTYIYRQPDRLTDRQMDIQIDREMDVSQYELPAPLMMTESPLRNLAKFRRK